MRIHYNLSTPDALHAASALLIKDEIIFLTGDKSFKKISNLNVTLL
jgi:predicted nucleic acid-binding protein